MSVVRVTRVVGALVEARPFPGASLHELVRVGRRGLLAEVLRVEGDRATLQVFEETSGLEVGEPVLTTGGALAAELGPGLLGRVLDGVGRPLDEVAARVGDFVLAGTDLPTLDRDRRWEFRPRRKPGERVEGGDVLGSVEERPGFEHPILLPPGESGTIAQLDAGRYSVEEPIGSLEDGTPLALAHRWPVRLARPVAEPRTGDRPLVTGQRVFDLLFPVAEGGTVAVPGGFGTGKTIIEQALAKHAQADVVVYVGCGERGNEMAEVLDGFRALTDPRSGRPLLDRTVLVVNTSNMPVAAREASTYLGITIAEYYRDLGYRVLVLADSLSRWAEALREIASRLEELPGEEGYPTYLSSHLGQLFERAGRCRALGRPERTGALTFVSAVSPPGGDFSEPVTQASLRVCGALWALDVGLAQQRQFPAVDWDTSYTHYAETSAAWLEEHGGAGWAKLRLRVLALLQRDQELREIAGLVGLDALEDRDRLALESARLLRELVIGQSALDPEDAFSPLARTHALASLCLELHDAAAAALAEGRAPGELTTARAARAIGTLRSVRGEALEAATAVARAAVARVSAGLVHAAEPPP